MYKCIFMNDINTVFCWREVVLFLNAKELSCWTMGYINCCGRSCSSSHKMHLINMSASECEAGDFCMILQSSLSSLLAHLAGLSTNSQICLSVKSWKPGSTSSFYKYSLYLRRVVRGTSVHVSAVKSAPLKSTVFKIFWVDTRTSFSITSFLNSLCLYCRLMFPWSIDWIKFVTFEEQAMEDDAVVIMHSLEQHTQVYGKYCENSMGTVTFQLVPP